MRLRDHITERYTPSVVVLATPEAEAACRDKNGLSVVDLLRPFGFFHHLSVPVRIVGEQAYRIKEFRLRFYEPKTMHQPAHEVAADHLKRVLAATAEKTGAEDDIDLLAALHKGELPEQTPWFDNFRQEFLRMLAFSDLHTVDQPVACLLVGHAHAEDVFAMFEELHTTPALTPAMRTGITDGRIARHYCLLHDADLRPPGGLPWAEEKLRSLRARLGEKACHLLQINSRSEVEKDVSYEGLFKAQRKATLRGGGAGEPDAYPPTPSAGLGAKLSSNDLKGISSILEEFSVRVLLPHLETRVRFLYHQVMATRKGVRNQLKNFLWRTKSSATETPKGSGGLDTSQGSQTPEGQLRVLADLAFLMQDYETCLAALRLLVSDLKSDREWRFYAAAQEMQALALFMGGYSMAEVISCFRDAFHRYDSLAGRGGDNTRRYATRSQLLLAEYCCQQSHYSEANAALMRAQSQEENLIAAVLLEQAALNLLHLKPPSIRKWAFHLVLAALRFSNCQQPRLANRAYRQVVAVFGSKQWSYIDSHLQDKLGNHAAEAENFVAAAQHFAQALTCPAKHPGRQRVLLQQFLSTLRQLSPEQLLSVAPIIPLPEVDTEHINVAAEDSATFANAHALSLSEEYWRAQSVPLLAGREGGQTQGSWLEGSRKSSFADVHQKTAVVGEEISLELDIGNPLMSELHISRLQASVEASASSAYHADEEDVTLRGGEKMRIRLKLKGLQSGLLKVTGIRWQLEGAAFGQKALQLRQLPQPRSRNSATEASRSGLSFNIISEMPRLQVEMKGLEGPVLEGEVVPCTALIRNAGNLPMNCLRLLVSESDLYCCSSKAFLGQNLNTLTDFCRSDEQGIVLATAGRSVKGGGKLYEWPEDFQLAAGASVEWPFFLHPRRHGQADLHCQWQYQSVPQNSAMPFRILRWSWTVDVHPNLSLQSKLLTSSQHLYQCLLQLTASTAEDVLPVKLEGIACTSHPWLVSPLNTEGTRSDLQSGETEGLLEKPLMASPTVIVWQLESENAALQAERGGNDLEWIRNGPLAHFHEDRKQHGSSAARALARRKSGEAVEKRSLEGTSAKQVVPLSPKPPPPSETDRPAVDFALVWSVRGGQGQPPRFGVHHILDCRYKDADLLRAVVIGERHIQWDFSKGPVQVCLKLRVHNKRDYTASLCCETGTTLDLLTTTGDQEGKGGRWQIKVPAEPPATAQPRAKAVGAGPPQQETPQGRFVTSAGPESCTSHIWTGQTRTSMPQLESGNTAEFPLQILFFTGGIYQVADYALFWTFQDGSLNEAKMGPPLLITIDSI